MLLKNLELKNTNRLILGHVDINSIVEKIDHLKVLIVNDIDILALRETKLILNSLTLNLELTGSQLLSDLTEIDLLVEFLFMLVRTYLVNN